MGGLKIITVNTNGLNNPIKRKRVLQKLKRDKGEIIFLHETHLNKEEHKKLEKLGGAQVFTSSFTSAKRGVSILVKECLNFKSEFIMEVKAIMIIAGDFNLVMDEELDTQSTRTHKSVKGATLLHQAGVELGLIDVWRFMHPQIKEFTHYSQDHNTFSRLDYIFMLKNDVLRVKSCEILPITVVDHAVVIMEMDLGSIKGTSMWRFNNFLLRDNIFKDKIIHCFRNYIQSNNNNGEVTPVILWEAAKVPIRGEITAYASWKKKPSQIEKLNLEKKLKSLQEKHEKNKNKEEPTRSRLDEWFLPGCSLNIIQTNFLLQRKKVFSI
uniref:exodeoxyribonuclease III n=1 Tax=Sinocyclocheilus anshuiensis TaxID=1608454 RepID=A0A671NUV2_9TELE